MLLLMEDLHRFERIWAAESALADGSGGVRYVYSVDLPERRVLLPIKLPKEF